MQDENWLAKLGGGAVVGEIKAHDWSSSKLGPVEAWPISLRTILSSMLACPMPMYLAWGPDLISFYNDSYRPILGYRATGAIGKPFKELWASLWSEIEPMVNEALAGGMPKVTDLKLDLSREGIAEESYWTFSYSPVFDDEGEINGMLCVTGETTARVVAERERDLADERLQMALSAGNSIGAWDWDVLSDRVTADARFAHLYGVDPAKAASGASIHEFFSGIHPDDLIRVQSEIKAAMDAGSFFTSEYRLTRQDGAVRWVSAQGRCLLDENGRCIRFPGISFDITERKAGENALRIAKEERDFVIDLMARQRVASDPDAIVRLTAEALGKRLGVHRVGFYRLLDRERLNHGVGWSDGTLAPLIGEHRGDAFGSYAARERSNGRTLIFSDSRLDFDRQLAEYSREGVLAGICVPLLDNGSWAAGIYVHQASVRFWSQADTSLVKEVAGLTWVAVERAEAIVRLAQRLDRQEEALTEATTEISNQTTRRNEAESIVRQLQKMEAVGQLTGGIAHDFNNMLAIVIGGLNLAQRRIARGDRDIDRYIDSALDGATRAASLTQRLLAFARQQPLSPEPIDANRLVGGITDLIGRTIGEQVSLETVLGAGIWKINADPNQLENAVLNLAINARDAMPEGGRLTIETANSHIDRDYAHDAGIASGQYVMLAVTDTGTGMPPEVLGRIFEPFFTTKSVGKGTGLGLSQVFGFLGQSKGHIKAYSEPGHGTTFKMYFPRYWGDAHPAVRRAPAIARGGRATEIILVVEDEERVRNFSVEALRELGYTVIHAANGAEALAMLRRGQDVTLLFTDVVMPEMNGRQLVELARPIRPAMKVIFTTGYTRNAVVHNGTVDPGTNLLSKPFSLDELASKVREVLDSQT